MKHISVLFSILMMLIVLVSCQTENENDVQVSFDISEGTLSTTGVSINIEIVDPSELITGTISVRLNDSSGVQVSNQTKTFASVEDAKTLLYSGLIPDNNYSIVINATSGRESIEIGTFTFKTLSLQSLNISTVEDFLAMGQNRSGDYVLQNDIDFSDVDFVTPFTSAFTGTFDGQGFTLSNITISNTRLYNGVFGYLSSGSIKNVTLDNVTLGTSDVPIETSSSTKTGILLGYQASSLSTIQDITIKNSHIYLTTSTSTYAYVGGVIGESRGNVFNVNVLNSSVNVISTSNANIRLGGAYGYIFESSKVYQHDVEIDTTFTLDAQTSTRVNRSYSISIGGFAGDVDPASVNNANIQSIRHIGVIDIPKLSFNPLVGDTGTYQVSIGGLFGNISRGIQDIYTTNSIYVTFEADSVETNVTKVLRVNGISPVYNTSFVPKNIVLEGEFLEVDFPEEITAQVFDGLARFSIDSLKTYLQLINDELSSQSNVVLIDDINEYFESSYMNDLLN